MAFDLTCNKCGSKSTSGSNVNFCANCAEPLTDPVAVLTENILANLSGREYTKTQADTLLKKIAEALKARTK